MFPGDGALVSAAGVPLKVTDIASELQGDLAAYAAIDRLETTLAQARKDLRANSPGVKAYLAELQQALVTFYRKGNPALAHFGFAIGKSPKKLTSAKQVVRVVKAAGTRAIRHTQGSAQKAAQKFQGQVEISTSVNSLAGAPGSGAGAAVSTTPAPATAAPLAPVEAGAAGPGSPPGAKPQS